MTQVFTEKEKASFRSSIIKWFKLNKRDLPWRTKSNWFKTYLSEIILQQTTVDQGLPYFLKFIKEFPGINDLAAAGEQDILKLWAGLGYYARARNMLKAAKMIVTDFAGEFPQDYKKALSIPGIGPYTAAAVLSIAYNKAYPVIDGNVIRVISRIFAIEKDTRSANTIEEIIERANSLLDTQNPGAFNEAMMELGALVCKPQNAMCTSCPIKNFCKARQTNCVDKIPYKSPPPAKTKKFNLVAVFKYKTHFYLVKRPGNGLLGSMWEFPALEVSKEIFGRQHYQPLKESFEFEGKTISHSAEYRHIYSHIDLRYRAFIIHLDSKNINHNFYQDNIWVKLDQLEQYPIHNAHKKLLNWLTQFDM